MEDDYQFAKENHCISVAGTVYADKLQIRTNQSTKGSRTPVNTFGTIIAGKAGMYIDGVNDGGNNISVGNLYVAPQNHYTRRVMERKYDGWKVQYYFQFIRDELNALFKIWDVNAANTHYLKYDNVASTVASIVGISAAANVEQAMQQRLESLLQSFGANENPLTYKEAVFGSANDDIWKNKLITIRSWSAPAHSTDKEDLEEARQSTMSAGRTTPMPASR